MKKKIYKNKQNYFIFLIVFSLIAFFFIFPKSKFSSNNTLKISKDFNKKVQNTYAFYFNNELILKKKSIKVKSGDTLQKILSKEKISKEEINKIYFQTKEKIDLTKIKQGQIINILFKAENNQSVSRINFQINDLSTAYIYFNNQKKSYDVKISRKNLEKVNFLAKGVIKNSLYRSAQKVDVDPEIIIEFARIFGFEIDFQRDIRTNDKFKIFYERYDDDEGETHRNGNILFAFMKNNGNEIKLYRYKDNKNNIGYFTPNGKSIEKALMKTPINGARLSSGYGFRKHPILGYNKLHQGTDFAARRGTPIMASGSGIVERASWYGAYGKYIRIRHNSTYKTAYAHLSKFAKNIKAGRKVQQGQIIGYVGSTGRSTGPHLHYEVLVRNKRINSQKLKLPSGRSLNKNEMKNFKIEKKRINDLIKFSRTNN